jgi:acyl CoA:acetate/3-ketoacid CoA transferase
MKTIALADAVAMISDGARLLVGGFMGVGTPEPLIDELVRQGPRNLTVIANDTAMPGVGIGKLVAAGLLRKVIASHIGLNPETQRRMIAGSLEVELVPQGTLIERIRAGGFGLGGILTPTGVGTLAQEGKRVINVDGRAFHAAKGKPKIVECATLPCTSVRPVDLLVTELAVIAFPDGEATLLETAPGVTITQILAVTEARLAVAPKIHEMVLA